MRGSDTQNGSLCSYVSLEERIPARHPLRKIREVVNAALATLLQSNAKLDFFHKLLRGQAGNQQIAR